MLPMKIKKSEKVLYLKQQPGPNLNDNKQEHYKGHNPSGKNLIDTNLRIFREKSQCVYCINP
jgi:hypothetical protein